MEADGLSNSNLDVILSIYLGYNNTLADISKDDLTMTVMLQGRKGPTDPWTMIHDNSTIIRHLTCVSGSSWYFQIPGPQGNILKIFSGCEKINLFHLTSVDFPRYRATFTFTNARELWVKGMVSGDLLTEYYTTQQGFSIFECVFRVIFASYSAFSFLMFTVVVVRVQHWTKWHTTQKWLPALLFFQVFYHDPLYWIQILAGGSIWGFYNSFFSLTFIYIFLLYMIIFVHSLFVKPADRGFFSFYLIKFLLIGVCWIASMVLMLWSRYYNVANAASIRVEEVPGYQYFEILVIALLIGYGCMFLYYLFRGLGNVLRFRDKYSNRFKAIGSLSIFVVLAMTGVTLIQGRSRFTSQGFTFLVSHAIIFYYFNTVAFLFLPSGVPEPIKVEDIKVPTDPTSGVPQDEHFSENKNTEIPFNGDDHVLSGDEHKVAEVIEKPEPPTHVGELSEVTLDEKNENMLNFQ
jgi:hypothetical protein